MLWFIKLKSCCLVSSVALNTSYVMVHHKDMLACPMPQMYLNTSYVMVHHVINDARMQIDPKFKYILCYGSSPLLAVSIRR